MILECVVIVRGPDAAITAVVSPRPKLSISKGQ